MSKRKDKTHRPMTRKPCPGCGRQPMGNVIYRYVDEVCNSCKILLREAKEQRERQAQEKELIPVKLGGKPRHFWPGYYGLGPQNFDGFDNVREDLRDAMAALTESIVGEPIYEWKVAEKAIRPYHPKSSWEPRYRNEDVFYMDASVQKALEHLDACVREAIRQAYNAGKEDGSNLLMNIAEGKVSVRDLNKASIEEGRNG